MVVIPLQDRKYNPRSNFWYRAGSGHISTRPVPATCHSRGLTSPIVTDAWSLCCLLPIGSPISTLGRRAACRGGMGRHDPLTMPGHGIIRRTCARRGAVPVTISHVSGACTKERKGPATLKDFLSLSFFSCLPL